MKIGILGAGQLGVMLAEAAFRKGHSVVFYDPNPLSPGFDRTRFSLCGAWTDIVLLTSFFHLVDVVTYEFENVDITLLADLQAVTGKKIFPNDQVLYICQNRDREKDFLKRFGFPAVWNRSFQDKAEVEAYFAKSTSNDAPWPKSLVIKTVTGGYDGKGQWVFKQESATGFVPADFLSSLEERYFPVIVEEFVDLHCELSCIVARQLDGHCVVFPIFENSHKNQILDYTILPAFSVSQVVQQKVQDIAVQCALKMDVIGLLTVEFFVVKKKSNDANFSDEFEIYVNEFAPRPHNSGHITNTSCQLSQFDAHIAAITGEKIPAPKYIFENKFTLMGNLLGDTFISQKVTSGVLHLGQIADVPFPLSVTLYGKKEAKPDRKMGHFVLQADSPNLCKVACEETRQRLAIEV